MPLLGSFSLFNKRLFITCRNWFKYNFATDYFGMPHYSLSPQWVLPASSTPPLSHPVSVSIGHLPWPVRHPSDVLRSPLFTMTFLALSFQCRPSHLAIQLQDALPRTLFPPLNLRSIYGESFTESFVSVCYPLPYDRGKANMWECVPRLMGRHA